MNKLLYTLTVSTGSWDDHATHLLGVFDDATKAHEAAKKFYYSVIYNRDILKESYKYEELIYDRYHEENKHVGRKKLDEEVCKHLEITMEEYDKIRIDFKFSDLNDSYFVELFTLNDTETSMYNSTDKEVIHHQFSDVENTIKNLDY